MTTPDTWTRKDAWLGVLFLFAGTLLACYAVLAYRNEFPLLFWASAALLGPVFLFLGGNALVRSLGARR